MSSSSNLRIAKFSVHVFISVATLAFCGAMLVWDPAGVEYRPMWSGMAGTILGVWIKKWKTGAPPAAAVATEP